MRQVLNSFYNRTNEFTMLFYKLNKFYESPKTFFNFYIKLVSYFGIRISYFLSQLLKQLLDLNRKAKFPSDQFCSQLFNIPTIYQPQMEKFINRWPAKESQNNFKKNEIKKSGFHSSLIQLKSNKSAKSQISQQNLIQDTAVNSTSGNSLAKKNYVSKSLISMKSSDKSMPKYVNSANNSSNKRKKFISVTQQSGKKDHQSIKKRLDFNQKKQDSNLQEKQQQKTPKGQIKQASSVFLLQIPSLKEYLSNMIKNITESTITPSPIISQNLQEEMIMNEQILQSEVEFENAQRANQQRKLLSLRLGKKYQKVSKRINTQVLTTQIQDSFSVQNQRYATQAQFFQQSRNKLFFQIKVGDHTLTRKDSPILNLHQLLQKSQTQTYPPVKQLKNQMAQVSNNLNAETAQITRQRFISLAQNAPTNNNYKKKQKKLKFLSLIQKQQSFRYKKLTQKNENK